MSDIDELENHVESRTKAPVRRLREELDRELAVLRAPGAGDKLREIFAASPQDIADAANAVSDDERSFHPER